jgi:hypothetical protein
MATPHLPSVAGMSPRHQSRQTAGENNDEQHTVHRTRWRSRRLLNNPAWRPPPRAPATTTRPRSPGMTSTLIQALAMGTPSSSHELRQPCAARRPVRALSDQPGSQPTHGTSRAVRNSIRGVTHVQDLHGSSRRHVFFDLAEVLRRRPAVSGDRAELLLADRNPAIPAIADIRTEHRDRVAIGPQRRQFNRRFPRSEIC